MIPAASVTTRSPQGVMPMDDLARCVAALDNQAMPLAEMRWDGLRRAVIRAPLGKDQVISVQTNYHMGWHARANGQPLPVLRNGIGFLLLRPNCEGPCEVELTYDGGWEFLLCRAISYMTLIAVVYLFFRPLPTSFFQTL